MKFWWCMVPVWLRVSPLAMAEWIEILVLMVVVLLSIGLR